MNFFNYSIRQKKIITVLMCINLLALITNFLGIQGRIASGKGEEKIIFNFFTNSKGFSFNFLNYWEDVRFNDNYQEFWPFVEFEKSSNVSGLLFKGVFCYFDFSEFIIYSLIIFGTPLLIKLFKQK